MADTKSEAKSSKDLENGMYEVEFLSGSRKGEVEVYHSSTAESLQGKNLVKVGKLIKNYQPRAAKK